MDFFDLHQFQKSVEDRVVQMIGTYHRRNAARLLRGQVTSVDATNKRVNVQFGTRGTATNLPYLTTYSPAVNDWVAVMVIGSRNYLVLGPVNAVV